MKTTILAPADVIAGVRNNNIEVLPQALFLFARGVRDGFNPEFEPSTSEWLSCLMKYPSTQIRTAIGDSGLARFRRLFLNVNQDLPPAVGLISDIDRCQLTLAGSDSLGARPRAWTSGWQTLAFVLVPLRAHELQAARGFLARSVPYYNLAPDALDAAYPSIAKTRVAKRHWLRAIEQAAETANSTP